MRYDNLTFEELSRIVMDGDDELSKTLLKKLEEKIENLEIETSDLKQMIMKIMNLVERMY